MSSDDGTVYMIRGESEDEWVSPAPADEVIVESLVESGALTGDEIDDLATYVDLDELRAVVNGADADLTFTVEGHDVTVTSDGDVSVA